MKPGETAPGGGIATSVRNDGSDDAAPEAGPILDSVEVCTAGHPRAAVIWLHGLGADGHDFEPVVPLLAWDGAPAIRYVFPHAPVRPVTINGGMEMRAWYDILSIDGSRAQDHRGIAESVRLASALVWREIRRGVAPENIVLAGFSQGGAITILAALGFPRRLAGAMVLSSYLLYPEKVAADREDCNADLPFFVAHGRHDPMLPLAWGRDAASTLESAGHPVEWHDYPIAHSVCPEEIADIAGWLSRVLG